MESDIIHVTEGTQCSAKQALIMTEEVAGIKIFKGFPSHHRFLACWLLVPSKACQSRGKTRAMQRGIMPQDSTQKTKNFAIPVCMVEHNARLMKTLFSIILSNKRNSNEL